MNSLNIVHKTLLAGMLTAVYLLSSRIAFAQTSFRWHDEPHGRVVARVPADHHRFHLRGIKYYYCRGIFYRKGANGFKIVAAPIGVVIPIPPAGSSTVIVSGLPHYRLRSVYYRKVSEGYMVVKPAPKAMVAENPPQRGIPEAVLPEYVRVTAAALNLRKGPGLNYDVIDRVQRDDTLCVVSIKPGWLYVRLPSGQSGWVMDNFTVPIETQASG